MGQEMTRATNFIKVKDASGILSKLRKDIQLDFMRAASLEQQIALIRPTAKRDWERVRRYVKDPYCQINGKSVKTAITIKRGFKPRILEELHSFMGRSEEVLANFAEFAGRPKLKADKQPQKPDPERSQISKDQCELPFAPRDWPS